MPERAAAVAGLFAAPGSLLAAVRRLRAEGHPGRLEALTPWPLHGLPEALGLKASPLPGMVFATGIFGALAAAFLQWFLAARDYPIVVGGKPPGSWQALVPIMFEVTVLFATLTAGVGMLALLNRLPAWGHPLLGSRAIRAATRDRFILALEPAAGESFDVEEARRALERAGAEAVEVVPEPPDPGPALPGWGYALLFAAALVAPPAAAGLAYAAVKAFPVLPPMVRMLDQPRVDALAASRFFADGRSMRLPPEGAVARGRFPRPPAGTAEAALLVNPLPATGPVFARGRALYATHCLVCHGALGDGKPLLSAAYGAKPADLHAARVREAPDGELYRVVAAGIHSMPAYWRDLSPDEIWSVVRHVRALQRALHAKEEDVR